jgi:hypothetical protein
MCTWLGAGVVRHGLRRGEPVRGSQQGQLRHGRCCRRYPQRQPHCHQEDQRCLQKHISDATRILCEIKLLLYCNATLSAYE